MIRLHEDALKAAGEAIRRDRYLMHSISDRALAEKAIVAYKEAVPQRASRPRPPRPAKS